MRRILLAAAFAAATITSEVIAADGSDPSAQTETLAARAFETTDAASEARYRARLTERSANGDQDARFALGALLFFDATETFVRTMNRHGLRTQGWPVPRALRSTSEQNRSAAPLDYATLREHLETFRAGMDRSRRVLADVDRDAPVALAIDLAKVRVLLDEASPPVSLLELGAVLDAMGPRRARRSAEPLPSSLPFRFDAADVVWLRGYATLIGAQLDFLLAHDFERLFEETGHVLFVGAATPIGDLMDRTSPPRSSWDAAFDWVAMVRLVDLPVIDAARRAGVRNDLLEVVRLSRENWRLIRAESDAEGEWLPGPHQRDAHPVPGVNVEAATVEAWMGVLDQAEAVLEGRLLVPHPRFGGTRDVASRIGIDVKAWLEADEPFDLVLFLTGHGAVPHLREGPVLSQAKWREVERVFGERGLLGTALWFN